LLLGCGEKLLVVVKTCTMCGFFTFSHMMLFHLPRAHASFYLVLFPQFERSKC
jgi:hypothetical protein